jgi:hypothetical protein
VAAGDPRSRAPVVAVAAGDLLQAAAVAVAAGDLLQAAAVAVAAGDLLQAAAAVVAGVGRARLQSQAGIQVMAVGVQLQRVQLVDVEEVVGAVAEDLVVEAVAVGAMRAVYGERPQQWMQRPGGPRRRASTLQFDAWIL